MDLWQLYACLSAGRLHLCAGMTGHAVIAGMYAVPGGGREGLSWLWVVCSLMYNKSPSEQANGILRLSLMICGSVYASYYFSFIIKSHIRWSLWWMSRILAEVRYHVVLCTLEVDVDVVLVSGMLRFSHNTANVWRLNVYMYTVRWSFVGQMCHVLEVTDSMLWKIWCFGSLIII